MTKEESLTFLQECMDRVENATDEEIEKFKKIYKNEMLNYKSMLEAEADVFHDYLGSCGRYLQNKRLNDIKYQG